METALLAITGIISTGHVVVAIRGPPREALPIGADISRGALVAIVTKGIVMLVNATDIGVTRIIRTNILVIAIQGDAVALARCANVVSSTGIPIITGQGVIEVQTPCYAVTGIICARVFIVTIEHHAPHAKATVTVIVNGAQLTIITGHRIGFIDTSLGRGAAIVGTQIIIVTRDERPRQALPRTAHVPLGTGVVVGTRPTILGKEGTAVGRVT
jgi:hypothetical protein